MSESQVKAGRRPDKAFPSQPESKRLEVVATLFPALTRAINQAATFETAIEATLALVCRHAGWLVGESWLLSADKSSLELSSLVISPVGGNEALEEFRASTLTRHLLLNQSLPGRAWRTRALVWVMDVSTLPPEEYVRTEVARRAGLRSALAVPVQSGEEVVAVLVFYHGELRPEETWLTEVFLAVATQLGALLERKQAEVELQRHVAQVEGLAKISRALAEAGLDSHNVLETVVRYTAEFVGDCCFLSLLSADGQRLRPVAFHHPNPEARAFLQAASLPPAAVATSVARQVIQASEPILIPVVDQAAFYVTLSPVYQTYMERYGIHSVLIVGLRTREGVIGTLAVTRDTPGQPYTPTDQAFLQSLADHAALALTNSRLYGVEREQRELLQAYGSRLAEAEEAERRRLAQEIHDRLGQNLTALSIDLNLIKSLLRHKEEHLLQIYSRLDDSLALVEQTIEQMRTIVHELRPAVLDDYGLAPALRWHAQQFSERSSIPVQVWVETPTTRLPAAAETALFRIAQEALTNVAKHARARRVTVTLESTPTGARLCVTDDGVGFDPADLAGRKSGQSGWGLLIMHERAESVGGNLQIQATTNKGTAIIVEVNQ
ncbi:MAG: GAF domain-containing sensor histidine kinase [Chloroflexi bacterium]|nr:GAF domain-containing sensor histidine kinase [Chloroflexota bacterium]MCI0576720.1 GAF domain-containing sensor histidine kinase [Chloroflexota bacterium]MCI0645532.1 GAF domain-containing sensor histidine kinase [Chloroflexota bacterium]